MEATKAEAAKLWLQVRQDPTENARESQNLKRGRKYRKVLRLI
jgi:hypothetical protein